MCNAEKIENSIKVWEEVDYLDEGMLVVGRDFKIRIGREGSLISARTKQGEREKRASKDLVTNNGSAGLVDFISKKGWSIANGNFKGDEAGEFTFIGGKVSTVIDYIIINEKTREKVVTFKVEDRIESDHAPICLEIKLEVVNNEKSNRDKQERKSKQVFSWNEEDIAVFRAQTEEMEDEQTDDPVEKRWKEAKEMVEKAAVKKEIKQRKWRIGEKKWWHRNCSMKKREVKAYRDWKQGKDTKEKYLTGRREWKVMCRSKEQERREMEMEQIRNIKNENEIWKRLNLSSKKKVKVENKISKKEWKDHFRSLLEGSDERRLGNGESWIRTKRRKRRQRYQQER